MPPGRQLIHCFCYMWGIWLEHCFGFCFKNLDFFISIQKINKIQEKYKFHLIFEYVWEREGYLRRQLQIRESYSQEIGSTVQRIYLRKSAALKQLEKNVWWENTVLIINRNTMLLQPVITQKTMQLSSTELEIMNQRWSRI